MTYISNRKVRPQGIPGSPIMIIGEAPGYEEDKEGLPFQGAAGEELDRVLGLAGISRSQCYITNVCNYRPADNDFNHLRYSVRLTDGIKECWDYIKQYKSSLKLVIILGSAPLEFILGKRPINKWRGSFITVNDTLFGITLHPALVSRFRENYPKLAFDFRTFKDVLDNGYTKPENNFTIDPQGLEKEQCIREIINAPKISVDIETSKKNPKYIRCIGFGLSPSRAISFSNDQFDGLSSNLRTVVDRIFAAQEKKWIYHNGYAFDIPVLRENSFEPPQVTFDTIIAARDINPEMEKDLGFLTSIHTWRPYYKNMTADEDEKILSDKTPKELLMEYNCLDCVATFEIAEEQELLINKDKYIKDTFEFDMSLVPMVQHLSYGMLVDTERRNLLKTGVEHEIGANYQVLKYLAGKGINPNGKMALRNFLYTELGLPIQKKRDGKVTTDENALIKLITHCQKKMDEYKRQELKDQWEKRYAILKLIIILRGLLKLRSSYLIYKLSQDGRAKSSYHLSPETGRASCSMYIDNTGLNAQTFPRDSFEIIEKPSGLSDELLDQFTEAGSSD